MPALRKMVIDLPESPDLAESLHAEFPAIDFVPETEESRLPEAMRGADAMLTWNITPEALHAADQLKWVQAVSAGVDRFLTPAFRERDIVLTNTSGVHASNIAEHVLALMLAFARRLPQLLAAQHRHEWQHVSEEYDRPVFELSGQTVLIAGMGDIGQALAQRTQCLGMSIIGVRRHPSGASPFFEVATDRLHEVLPEAEHVVDTLPLTPATRGLFDDRAFAAMKDGSYFYNIGRGPTADTTALMKALRSGKLAGAGLDVVDPEPLPSDSPLWELPNVIITAHTSGQTPFMRDRIRALLAENIRRYQHGEPLMNVVNQSEGY